MFTGYILNDTNADSVQYILKYTNAYSVYP